MTVCDQRPRGGYGLTAVTPARSASGEEQEVPRELVQGQSEVGVPVCAPEASKHNCGEVL